MENPEIPRPPIGMDLAMDLGRHNYSDMPSSPLASPSFLDCLAANYDRTDSPLNRDHVAFSLSPGERSEVSQSPDQDLEANRVKPWAMNVGMDEASRPTPATPQSAGACSMSGRQEVRLGLSPKVIELRPEVKVVGRSRVGRCAGPSISQSSERIFLPIETLLRDQPAAIWTTASGRVSRSRLMPHGNGHSFSDREPGWEPLGTILPSEPSPSHSRCLPRDDEEHEEFQWAAGLFIGDSTLGSHAGSGLFHLEGIPLLQGAIAYLGQYKGLPIKRELVERGSAN